MNADMFVVRHAQSGAPHLIAAHLNRTGSAHVHVVNAGDGRHAHPTQGLLDLFTIRHYKKDFRNLTVAIVGDVLHSRVARSLIHGLTTLGVPEVRVIGPQTLLPTARAGARRARVPRHARGAQGLRRGRDAAAAERADARRAAAVGRRVLQALRPDAREACDREARRDRDAPGADEPRRRDRLGGGRRRAQRDPAAGDLRHRGADGGDEHPGRELRQAPEIVRGRLRAATAHGHAARSPRGGVCPHGRRAQHEDRNQERPLDRPEARGRPQHDALHRRGQGRGDRRRPAGWSANRTIDARGLVVCPGLIDLSARLREPGFEYKATLESEMRRRSPAASPASPARPTPIRRWTSPAWSRCSSTARARSTRRTSIRSAR